jgi:putative nucleotidyltransferase with HDIG domain
MTVDTLDNRVKQVISNIRNLPTPPIVFHQIQKAINDPNVSAGQVAAILSEDPAMSVKVLKLTNSAFYGLSREIEAVKEAVVIVGMEAIKNLVLSASVLDMFKSDNIDQEFQEKFWRHSLATAVCSRLLARRLRQRGIVDPDAAFSAGLLHDVGKMVLSCFLPEEYSRFSETRSADRKSTDYSLELDRLGYTHAQVGSYLAIQWKLPQRLNEAIAFHHEPLLSQIGEPIAHIVHIGNYLAKQAFLDRSERHLLGSLDEGVVALMEFPAEEIESYTALLQEEYVKAETFMKMAGIS